MGAEKSHHHLTAIEVLRRYNDELLPSFADIPLEDVNQVGRFDERPIHIACARGIMEEVKALVEADADVNAPGDIGDTPLHEAVSQNHVELVRFLLEHGASTKHKNELGETALDIAKLPNREDIIKVLEG